MFTYKRTIKSGPMIEVEYYQSIRKRNKKNVARGTRQTLSSEKQKQANIINGIKRTQRFILNNFKPGDWWVKLGFKNQVTEEEANRQINNFLRRYKYYLQKQGKEFKYIGIMECGAKNSNWHLHLVIEKSDLETLSKIWGNGGVFITQLFAEGNFYELAKYIRKEVSGKKRLKQSRNLKAPEIDVKEVGKREVRKLERGEMIKIPQSYYLVENSFYENEFTGTRYNFVFCKLDNIRN